KAFEGATEAVVIELVGSQVVVIREAGVLGPLADAKEGFGLKQAVGDQDFDEGAQGNVPFPRDEAINGFGEVELLEVPGNDGQGTEILGLEASRSIHGWSFLGKREAFGLPRMPGPCYFASLRACAEITFTTSFVAARSCNSN